MSNRVRILGPALLVLCGAAGAHAGTVYVAMPGTTLVGSASWDADLTLANPSTTNTVVSGVLLADDTDGTARTGILPAQPPVPAGASVILKPAASFGGLVELTGSPFMRYTARLNGHGANGQMGVDLPIITSADLVAANGSISLQGLFSSSTRATSVGIVNVGQSPSQCTIVSFRPDGTPLGDPLPLQMKPLSQHVAVNFLSGLVGGSALSDLRVSISCTTPFYAYALLTDTATGEVSVIAPAATGDSTLVVPGAQAPCPTGATCLSSLGIVHSATQATPVGRVAFNAPAGTYTRLRMSLDVTVGSWFAPQPQGKHLVYWFVINRNLDMPGMLYFRGPLAYTALVRYGIGLKHPQKLSIQAPFQAAPGSTYHVVNDFDMGHGTYTVTIADAATGQLLQTLTGVPNVSSVTLKSGDHFLVDMGFREGVTPDEEPGYGWVWSNVRVDVIP